MRWLGKRLTCWVSRDSLRHLMRQSSIPKTIEAALNELFDAHPIALAALLQIREPKDSARDQATIDNIAEIRVNADGVILREVACVGTGAAQAYRPDETVGLLDVVNAVLAALAPDKQLSTIQGPGGLEGFVLARPRKPQAVPVSPSLPPNISLTGRE